nr:hypothetical protein CFP56_22045 [Quercus suber]
MTPVFCALVLFFSSSVFTGKDWAGMIERILQGAPRAALLLILAVLAASPFVLLWMAMMITSIRNSYCRTWLLGGALAGVSFPIALYVAFVGDLPGYGSLDLQLFLWAHLGLVHSAAIQHFLSRKRRRSTLDNMGEEHEVGVSMKPSDKEIPLSEKPKAAARAVPAVSETCDERAAGVKMDSFEEEVPSCKKPETAGNVTPITTETGNYRLTLLIIIILTWLAELECEKVAAKGLPDIWTPLEHRVDKILLGLHVFEHLGWLCFYVLATRWYMRTTNNLAWEGACGLLSGLAGLATLRLSTSDMSRLSWTIDGALTLVAVNASLGVGVLTRQRLIARSFSTNA